MNHSRIVIVSLVALLFVTAGLDAKPKEFAGSTTVLVVEVPVTVVRGGEPVRGLTAEDFEVLDRGESRPLVGFEVIDLEAVGLDAAGETPSVPAVAQRHFLMLYDLSFSRTKALVQSIRGGREMVASLHPTDRTAVAVFGLSGGARVLLNFTSDRGQLLHVHDVLERLVDRDLEPADLDSRRPRRADPLRLVAGDVNALSAEIGRAAGIEISHAGQQLENLAIMGSSGLAPDLQTENIVHMTQVENKQVRDRRRVEVMALADAFSGIADITRGIEGRKYLVYFSEGFENYLLDDNGNVGLLRELDKMFGELRTSGWAIQSIDPGGVRAADEDFNTTNSLVLLARETGGDFYQNSNDVGVVMESMLAKTGVTYLLAFQSPEIALDGSFHPIKVRLRDGAKGRLSHRAGYLASNPAETPTGAQQVFSTGEMILSGEDGGELEVAARVTALKSRYGGLDVAVWVEADGSGFLKDFDGEPVRTDLFVYALDEHGEVRDYLTRRIDIDPAKVEERLAQGGDLKFFGHLHLDPGEYDLRILVRAGDGALYGLRNVKASIAEIPSSGPVLLDTVIFADHTRPSIVVREVDAMSSAGMIPTSYPFRIGDGDYFPAVRPALAAHRPARISLLAYEIGDLLIQRASIVRGDGSPVESGSLEVAGKDSHDGLEQIFFDFRPDELEPGEYEFQVALQDPWTQTVYESSMRFRLVH